MLETTMIDPKTQQEVKSDIQLHLKGAFFALAYEVTILFCAI